MSMQVYQEDITISRPAEHAGKPAKFVAIRVPNSWQGCIYSNDELYSTWTTPLTETNRRRPGIFDWADGKGETAFLEYARLHADFQHGILFQYQREIY